MNDKSKKMIELLRSQVDRGIYVWGGNGQAVSEMSDPEAWIRKRESGQTDFESNVKRDMALMEKRIQSGVSPVLAFDCSGLMYWAGKQIGIFKSDLSSRSIFDKCNKIGIDDLDAGDFVFRTDKKGVVCHVGMYIGGGKTIECKGRDVGVVELPLGKSWTLFGRFPALQETPKQSGAKYVKVVGGSVRVRGGNGTAYKTVGIVHRGDELLLLGQAEKDPYWWRVEYRGAAVYISSNERYTEVICRAK